MNAATFFVVTPLLLVAVLYGLYRFATFVDMTRGQYWFVASSLLVVVFGFPFVVAFAPGAASMCADRVEGFDSASAGWAWAPPGVECRVSLDNGGMTRFVLPWQQPRFDG